MGGGEDVIVAALQLSSPVVDDDDVDMVCCCCRCCCRGRCVAPKITLPARDAAAATAIAVSGLSPPPSGRRRGGGRLLVESAQDMEQWGSRVSKVIWGGLRIVGTTSQKRRASHLRVCRSLKIYSLK